MTHKSNNTPDLVITKSDATFLQNVGPGHMVSDHYMVLFDIKISHTVTPTTTASFRKYKDIDLAKFTDDVTNKLERALSTHMSADELVETYNNTLETTLEAHAPLKMKKITQHEKVPWFSDAIANELRLHRQLEKCWRNDSTNREKFLQFYQQRQLVLNMLDQAERVYFHDVLHENRNNVKKIYNIVNKLLDRVKDLPLTPTNSNYDLANEFNDFFCNKITRIHNHLVSHNKNHELIQETFDNGSVDPPPFDSFTEVSIDGINKLIKACPSKSCELDPILTSLQKKTLPTLSSIIAEVDNTSITSGCFPTKLKEALIKPLLKKANLDLVKMNYRPVSNLAFVGKIIERVVAIQLINHISINKLMEPDQSAYKPFHSTEATLLTVKADILKCIDNQEIVCLVLLDLLAAFDKVDHTVLLNRLHERFGVTGTALEWFKSYV